jgi:hypothetical protein
MEKPNLGDVEVIGIIAVLGGLGYLIYKASSKLADAGAAVTDAAKTAGNAATGGVFNPTGPYSDAPDDTQKGTGVGYTATGPVGYVGDELGRELAVVWNFLKSPFASGPAIAKDQPQPSSPATVGLGQGDPNAYLPGNGPQAFGGVNPTAYSTDLEGSGVYK